MLRRLTLSALILALAVTSASAQSTYVGASLVGDVLRRSHSESGGADVFSADGETIGFALRLGTPLGSRWGVDLEFARPGEIETDFSQRPIPLASSVTWSSSTSSSPVPTVTQVGLAPQAFGLRSRTRERYSTLATSVWVDQELSRRISLVYLGGLGFYRSTVESEFSFDFPRLTPAIPAIPTTIFTPMNTKTVTYGVRPLVGLEARIGLTDHVQLVPGLRLHGLESGWLLRPAVGLAWAF